MHAFLLSAIVLAAQPVLLHGRSPAARMPVPCRAATGYFFQEFLALPGFPGYTPNGIEAATSVSPESLAQVRRSEAAGQPSPPTGPATHMKGLHGT